MIVEPRVSNLKFCITFDKTSVDTKSLKVCDLLQSSWIPDYRYKLNHTFFSIEHKPFLSFQGIQMKFETAWYCHGGTVQGQDQYSAFGRGNYSGGIYLLEEVG